jgi:hypothetical protein
MERNENEKPRTSEINVKISMKTTIASGIS